MGNKTLSKSIQKTYIYPKHPNYDFLSSISLFIMKSSLYIMFKSSSNTEIENSFMPFSEYMQYIKDYRTINKTCINHQKISICYYCNNCSEWLCDNCIQSHEESHLISNIPIESNISSKQYESKQNVQLIEQGIIKKIENLNKLNDIVNFYFDDYENNSSEVQSLKERYKAFYNMNLSLIQFTYIILSNYIYSSAFPNKTIKENFESNITLTTFENIHEIFRINKSKQYQHLKEHIEKLLDNPYNNMIIKPKLILHYYSSNFTSLSTTCFCYINNGDIIFNSFNKICFTNLKKKTKKYLGPFHTADITSIIEINTNTFASSSVDGSIAIFNKDSLIKLIKAHESPIYQIIKTKQYLISCSGDKKIKLYDINSPYELISTMNGHSADVLSLIQYDDNTLISGSTDRKIKIWSLQSHQDISTLAHYNVSSVKFLLLGQNRLMSTFSFYNPSVLDMNNYTTSEPFNEESDSYQEIILTQNESLIVMGSKEGSISLFDSRTYKNIDKARLYGEILQIKEIEDNMILVLNEKGVFTVFIISDYSLFK